jgi:hypothetical protein
MADYRSRIRQGLTQKEIARWRDVALNPVQVEWGRGFVLPEGVPESASRWGKAVAQLSLRNDSRYPQRTTACTRSSRAPARARSA